MTVLKGLSRSIFQTLILIGETSLFISETRRETLSLELWEWMRTLQFSAILSAIPAARLCKVVVLVVSKQVEQEQAAKSGLHCGKFSSRPFLPFVTGRRPSFVSKIWMAGSPVMNNLINTNLHLLASAARVWHKKDVLPRQTERTWPCYGSVDDLFSKYKKGLAVLYFLIPVGLEAEVLCQSLEKERQETRKERRETSDSRQDKPNKRRKQTVKTKEKREEGPWADKQEFIPASAAPCTAFGSALEKQVPNHW